MTTTMIPTSRTSTKTTYLPVEAEIYEARIVRVVGLGVQSQPPYQGQEKDPAFKLALTYELIGENAKSLDEKGEIVENIDRPSCVFGDMFLFPGAKRGKVFDLCQIADPSLNSVPKTLDWFFENLLGLPVNVEVNQYKNKHGDIKNGTRSITKMSKRYADRLDAARCDLVGFNPYTDDEESKIAYAKLYPFQRNTVLPEALDGELTKKPLNEIMPLLGSEPIDLGDGQKAQDKGTEAGSDEGTQPTAPAQDDADMNDDIPF